MELASQKTERTPRGQGKLLRERLIDAALAMVDNRESAAISIRAITKRAGVSPTAFYLHFESREELIRACLAVCFAQFRDEIREALAGIEEPPERLLEAGHAYIEFAGRHPERYALIFGAAPLPVPESASRPTGLAPASDAFQDLVRLVQDQMDEGDPRHAEAETLAKGIWSGLHGFVMLRRARPAVGWPDDREFARRLASAWLGAPA